MGRESLFTAFHQAADLVRDERHNAELSTARCARDGEWDLEAHYRSRAEGLADAEKILRGHAEEVRDA